MGYNKDNTDATESRTVSEGDIVIFTNIGGQTKGAVTEVYDDGSFRVNWMSNGEERGQVFTPSVFDRSEFVSHRPDLSPTT
jgi:hypothetical protein